MKRVTFLEPPAVTARSPERFAGCTYEVYHFPDLGNLYPFTMLHERGAQVDYCEVYERMPPAESVGEILESYGVDAPDIAVITSLEGLSTYADKIDDEGLDPLFDVPLLVVGSRIAGDVGKLGFTNPPVIVDNPKDDTILTALISWVMDEI